MLYACVYIDVNVIITCSYILIENDDDHISLISTKIGSCRPLRSCGKKIILDNSNTITI